MQQRFLNSIVLEQSSMAHPNLFKEAADHLEFIEGGVGDTEVAHETNKCV